MFGRVFHRVLDHVQHMMVGDGVDDGLALTPTPDEAGLEQNLQAGGDGAGLVILDPGQISDVSLFLRDEDQCPQPARIRQRLEDGGGVLEGFGIGCLADYNLPSF